MAQKRLDEIRKIRLEKVEKLRELGIDPYPAKVDGSPKEISIALKSLDKTVEVAGRIMGWRTHGNVIFADLKDESGTIQLWFQKNALKENFKILKLFDIGDFIFAKGKVAKTSAGEISIDVAKFQILTKSIRPLPSKWHGLKDVEERFRKRYVDLQLNKELKDLFRKKAIFWQSVRNFMVERGFLEVETPVLENTAGGADANPFVTHHDALDIDLYLRISMGELWQKRLMVAGYEKTFEIGRQFRNEGISREHLQDYTQMEFYWAYADYQDSMKLVEGLYKYVAKQTFGTLQFEINGKEVNLEEKWNEIDYVATIKDKTGIDVLKANKGDVVKKLKEMKIKYDEKDNKWRLVDLLWKSIRKDIVGPVFLTGLPVEISPLAKRMKDDPGLTERYQPIIAGSEMGNGYSELNDPIDQAQRFYNQQKLRDEGDSEAQMHDHDFVESLEYGMPPVTGFGVSERLFSFLAGKSIRETVLFPLLRPKTLHVRAHSDLKVKEDNSFIVKITDDLGIDYLQAIKLLDEYIKDKITKLHCIESETIMRGLAKHFGEDEEAWGIIGLLHDIDWETTKNDTSKHCILSAEILKKVGATDFLIETIQSHGFGSGWRDDVYYGPEEFKNKERSGKIQHALAAAETLTGLIVATALIRPDKKLGSVKLSSLKKKFKNKKFAANCNRDIMMECEKIGLTIDEFLEIGLKSLQEISGELGL